MHEEVATLIMKKELVYKPRVQLVGLSTRTNNQNEMNPQISKIGNLVQRFHKQNTASQIMNRTTPGVTLSVYTEYDSNEHGDYTFFIGEEVDSFANIPNGMQKLVIPPAQYQRFTTPSDKMPDVVINAWQQIWKMTSDDLEGKRTYLADFEIYDERARDPNNTSLDIYIGIQTV